MLSLSASEARAVEVEGIHRFRESALSRLVAAQSHAERRDALHDLEYWTDALEKSCRRGGVRDKKFGC